MKTVLITILFGLFVVLSATAKDKTPKEGGIKVRLGKDIDRPYDKVVKDKFAYGPKQDYDKKTKLTHIYLPYGDNPALYAEVKGTLTNPSLETGVGKFHCNGPNPGILTYKIEFDRPISELTFSSGRFEYGLTKGTVAGIEYSANGKKWNTIKEIEGKDEKDNDIVKNFVENFKAEGLNTKVIYIRYYSRSEKKAITQGGLWIQLWLAGNPNWGDVQKTFFIHQPQIWVKKK